MKKIKIWLILCSLTVLLAGCSIKNGETQREGKAIDFTVVENRKIPPKLLEVIEKNKEREIRMTYREGEDLYLVRGYGEQKTGGYSISVAECTEDEETIWFDTRLLGPESQDGLSKDPSYPYLVIKMEVREKEVTFL